MADPVVSIKADLASKIFYDEPTVYKRLRVDKHAKHFVTNCAESLKVEGIHVLEITAIIYGDCLWRQFPL